jgi:hypothetical protein
MRSARSIRKTCRSTPCEPASRSAPRTTVEAPGAATAEAPGTATAEAPGGATDEAPGFAIGTIPDAVPNDPTSCHHGVGTSNGGNSPSTTPSALTTTRVTVRVTTRILTSADACQQPQSGTCSSFARTPLSHD